MLSREERQAIVLDEAIRSEVREQLLEERKGRSSRHATMIAAANSPFVLWLLSTVIVGLFGWAYAQYDSGKAARAQTAELRRKLGVEVLGRLDNADLSLLGMARALDERRNYSPARIFAETVDSLDSDQGAIYPEFRGRRLASLLAELKTILPSDQLRNFDSVAHGYSALRTNSRGEISDSTGQFTPEELRPALEAVKEAQRIVGQMKRGFGT